MSQSMHVELTASQNRLGSVQVSAVMRGAEQYCLSLVENAGGDPSLVVDMPAEQMLVGDPLHGGGYFWIIKPDPDDPSYTTFGLIDEASKLNLNIAQPDQLAKLPGMLSEIADSIRDWVDSDSNITGQGAENEYYGNLPQQQGYNAKNGPLETLEELRLVKGLSQADLYGQQDILFGLDRNHDGILDEVERNAGGPASGFNSANEAGRGIAPFVTVHTVEANNATNLANVNDQNNSQKVRDAMTQAGINSGRVDQILSLTRRAGQASSVFDFCYKGGMTPEEVKKVYSKLTVTTAKTITGRININSAPREVLQCLPGLTQDDAETLLNKRSGGTSASGDSSGSGGATSTSGDVSWVYEALGPQKAAQVGVWLTNKSYQYSADIVALSGNGKTFKRVRIVLDGRSTPAKIIYRKDLTELGFPPDLEYARDSLRQGIPLAEPLGGTMAP
jgi:type II secretory pathway component PulK